MCVYPTALGLAGNVVVLGRWMGRGRGEGVVGFGGLRSGWEAERRPFQPCVEVVLVIIGTQNRPFRFHS